MSPLFDVVVSALEQIISAFIDSFLSPVLAALASLFTSGQ